METYSVLTSWGLFAGAVLVAAYYYWPEQRRPGRGREDAQHTAKKRRAEGPTHSQRSASGSFSDANGTTVKQNGVDSTRKRKIQTREPLQNAAPAVVVQADEPDDFDMNTRQFAAQMAQARKGADLSSKNTKEQRVKTVKQNSALNTPVLSSGVSEEGAEADDDLSPAGSPSFAASGDVTDMLEPTPSGPTSMRVTAPTEPQKEKQARQPKEEVVETKKQRQNRQRVEAQRLQREADEKERKLMEEKQRRSAREARGEPARNGVPASKPPAKSAWKAAGSTPVNGGSPAPANENQPAPLLDTFDVESNSSSNGGLEASTAATSTTSTGAAQFDYDDQLAQAMRQSEDESGWTTVAQPKKQKKKTANGEEAPPTPVLSSKTNVMPSKVVANGKPKGFQALEVEHEQRTGVDPNDASNWDA